MKVLFPAIVMFSWCAVAQAPSGWETGGLKNGRYWTVLRETAKTHFLVGFYEGMVAAGSLCNCDNGRVGSLDFSQVTVGEIVKGIDQFYSEPANEPVPVLAAIRILLSKLNGATVSEVNAETLRVRRAFAGTAK